MSTCKSFISNLPEALIPVSLIVCKTSTWCYWQVFCNTRECSTLSVHGAAEVKITYAENAAMSTQLYEVDVFMFFLKDLEAVTTNFYHDLWQSTRMHTPKVHTLNTQAAVHNTCC